VWRRTACSCPPFLARGGVPKTKQTASSLDPCSVCWQESQIPYLDCTGSNEVHHVLVGGWAKTLSWQIGV
jgi:hypothetical protein